MKKIIISCSLALIASLSLSAQDCASLFTLKEGSVKSYQTFGKKDKIESSSTQKVLAVESAGNTATITFENESFDKNNKSLGKGNITLKCDNGVIIIDMKSYLAAMNTADYQIDATNLEVPANLTVGQKLNDGSIKITMAQNGMVITNMSVTNRKVEAIEDVTTSAGTFKCYKISYDAETKMLFSMKTKVIEWFSTQVGLVKSESYDASNKKLSYTILSSLK
jgi:hypothetical protein